MLGLRPGVAAPLEGVVAERDPEPLLLQAAATSSTAVARGHPGSGVSHGVPTHRSGLPMAGAGFMSRSSRSCEAPSRGAGARTWPDIAGAARQTADRNLWNLRRWRAIAPPVAAFSMWPATARLVMACRSSGGRTRRPPLSRSCRRPLAREPRGRRARWRRVLAGVVVAAAVAIRGLGDRRWTIHQRRPSPRGRARQPRRDSANPRIDWVRAHAAGRGGRDRGAARSVDAQARRHRIVTETLRSVFTVDTTVDLGTGWVIRSGRPFPI